MCKGRVGEIKGSERENGQQNRERDGRGENEDSENERMNEVRDKYRAAKMKNSDERKTDKRE